jgi:hypothetical protein
MPKLIAYDLETSRIEQGTPELLYLTAFGDDEYRLSIPIQGKGRPKSKALEQDKNKNFCQILEQYLLTKENNKTQFVAWNANKYDGYFVVKALLESDRWHIQPYMTASKSLRGFKVKEKRQDNMKYRQKLLSFEFLDGMAMTGIQCKLEKFLKTFAPEYGKLKAPDFEQGEQFNHNNPQHVKYAERDSEGLYHAMKKVSIIIYDLTEKELKPTVGNLAIHYFMDNVPKDVTLKTPHGRVAELLHGPVKRGGYCWAAKQYQGPAWKYDINQAYAAAMRDAELPSGEVVHTNEYEKDKPGIYSVTIERKRKTKVPFYYKDQDGTGKFSIGLKAKCWLTTIEIEHLKQDGWNVTVITGYYWTEKFNMKSFVNKLEKLRSTDKDGPSGPLGTMVKALGNNAYGKTLEQLWDNEFILAKEQPEGYYLFDSFDPEAKYIFAKERKSFDKKYHLPQIGAFITAHVRCVVRESAVYDEDNFLYADTDCIAFSRKARHLHLDPTRYGSWKTENAGDNFIIIGKKAYWCEDGTTKAKGMMVRHLTKQHYIDWQKGIVPEQEQVQRQNLLKFISGHAMFKTLKRKGTDVSKLKTVMVQHGNFIPC